MAGPGQEEWNHGCDLCCWFETNGEGKRGEIHSTPDFFFALISDTLNSLNPCPCSWSCSVNSNRWRYNWAPMLWHS